MAVASVETLEELTYILPSDFKRQKTTLCLKQQLYKGFSEKKFFLQFYHKKCIFNLISV